MEPQIAEIQISYHPRATQGEIVTSSQDLYKFLMATWNLDTICLFEEFKVLFLDRSNKIIGIYPLSKGGITSTVADIRLIFGIALKTAASSIILAHNHPSGQLKASNEDRRLTRKIQEAGDLLEIKVLDHLILNLTTYLSFADEGLI